MAGADRSEGIEALLDAVRELWPADEVVLERRTGRPAGSLVELVAVPHARAPRLLVPMQPAGAASRSMLRFSSATPARESVARLGVAGLLAAHLGRLLPDRVVVRGDGTGSLAAHLTDVLGRPVVLSLGVGTARVNRKPVGQVFDLRGRGVAFVKVGMGAVSRADVTAEAAALDRLAGRTWRHFALPRVLHFGPWGDAVVLVLSPLPSSAELRPGAAATIPFTAMRELADAFAGPAVPVSESGWFQRQRTAATGLADDGHRERMTSALDGLADLAGDRPQPTAAWHGDWTPWNMSRHRGRLQLWDWERFEEDCPPGLDPCHFAVNLETRNRGTRPDTIRRGLEHAGATRLGGALYLAAALGRYLPLVQVEHGDRIAARAEVFLQVLEERLNLDPPTTAQ